MSVSRFDAVLFYTPSDSRVQIGSAAGIGAYRGWWWFGTPGREEA